MLTTPQLWGPPWPAPPGAHQSALQAPPPPVGAVPSQICRPELTGEACVSEPLKQVTLSLGSDLIPACGGRPEYRAVKINCPLSGDPR